MLLRKKSTKINTALPYGLVHREQFNEVPPHVEYSLTDMGHDLLPVFYAIMNWGFKYEKEIFEVKEDK